MATIWVQLDDDTQAKIKLLANYQTHYGNRNIVEFFKSLCDIGNGSNDGGLSYQPFKVVSALKSLSLFSSQDVTNVHYFKKELKVKYKATKAICGKFPCRTKILVYVMVHFPGGAVGNTLTSFYNFYRCWSSTMGTDLR